jgi:NAD(P)-dependent dehydrogenase (short-subunit alcohol dehydrogenase family)
LVPLPEPDTLDFAPSDGSVCLLTDDHSATTTQLAQALVQRGWQVVVIRFPIAPSATPDPLPSGAVRVTLENWSEDHLKQQISTIASTYGTISAFIHLNPVLPVAAGIQFLEVEKQVLKQVFLMAKHLKKMLNQAAQVGRSCFFTVSRLDGAFGLSQTVNFGAIGGGLAGLTKTLNAEWYAVFCRAIDLSPTLAAQQSVQAVLAELYDPDRNLQEVAYTPEVRQTLVASV